MIRRTVRVKHLIMFKASEIRQVSQPVIHFLLLSIFAITFMDTCFFVITFFNGWIFVISYPAACLSVICGGGLIWFTVVSTSTSSQSENWPNLYAQKLFKSRDGVGGSLKTTEWKFHLLWLVALRHSCLPSLVAVRDIDVGNVHRLQQKECNHKEHAQKKYGIIQEFFPKTIIGSNYRVWSEKKIPCTNSDYILSFRSWQNDGTISKQLKKIFSEPTDVKIVLFNNSWCTCRRKFKCRTTWWAKSLGKEAAQYQRFEL